MMLLRLVCMHHIQFECSLSHLELLHLHVMVTGLYCFDDYLDDDDDDDDCSVVFIEGELYLFGGYTNESAPSNELWKLVFYPTCHWVPLTSSVGGKKDAVIACALIFLSSCWLFRLVLLLLFIYSCSYLKTTLPSRCSVQCRDDVCLWW